MTVYEVVVGAVIAIWLGFAALGFTFFVWLIASGWRRRKDRGS